MNNNILQAFAKNGLQILQWCMLVLLYEADGERLTQEQIHQQLDLPTSDPPPGGANKNALVREILRSSQKIDGYVRYDEFLRDGTWELTERGRSFVEDRLAL